MKKKYMAPAINVVRIDGSILQSAISTTSDAADHTECYSKHSAISFDDDEDMTSAW